MDGAPGETSSGEQELEENVSQEGDSLDRAEETKDHSDE